MDTIFNYAIEKYRNIKCKKPIGIFGCPIKHTLSPVIHDSLSEAFGFDERYIPFLVSEEKLGDCVKMAYEEGIQGLNITVPHKQEVMKYLVETDAAASAIGAVNTLVRTDNGFRGYNTDMPGLAMALRSEGISLKDKKIIMLGAGGAARAVAYMCLKYGAAVVYILNRSFERAGALAEAMNKEFNCEKITPLTFKDYKKVPEDKYIFFQCTSVGLKEGDGLPLDAPSSFYSMAEAGIDLIYNPSMTPFLMKMEELGIKYMNGLGMLLYQGILAYELWNGVKVDDEKINMVMLKLKKAVYGENIVLTGFMGSGKSAVGKYIAEHYGYKFLDTDEYIENEEGMTIPEIFEKKGETYFRAAEERILEKLGGSIFGTVVSTGGGMPLGKNNAGLLKKLGKVFYLEASPETIYKRIGNDTGRPLLRVENPYGRIKELIEVRKPVYSENCDIKIAVDDMDIQEAAREITSETSISTASVQSGKMVVDENLTKWYN